MGQLRSPHELERQHFVEIVRHFRQIQDQTGLSPIRKLKAELKRFGYISAGAGLKIEVEPWEMEDVEDFAVLAYLELIKHLKVGTAKRA